MSVERLSGKVAFVTGAARGQGRSHALRLARDGADLALFDIADRVSEVVPQPPATRSDFDQTVKMVEGEGRRVVSAVGDVRRFSDLTELVQRAERELGGIDIVVANAGVATYGALWEITEEAWDAVVDTNLKGAWNTVRAAVPGMIARGRGGAIVLTSSVAGIRGLVGLSHYAASKHGVTGLTRAFANELAPYRIRVNSVHPGSVGGTGMGAVDPIQSLPADQHEPFRQGTTGPLPGRIMVDDISNAVAWLVSDDACFVTGVQLPIDAGN